MSTDELNDAQRAFVLIEDVSKNVYGSGFLWHGKISTNAHVICAALKLPVHTESKPNGCVYVRFPFLEEYKLYETRVIHWCPAMQEDTNRSDIAILKINAEPPKGSKPARPTSLKPSKWTGQECSGYGSSTAHPDGGIALGKLLDYNKGRRTISPYSGHEQYFFASGYSGTAVWDEKHSRVFGMLVTATDGTASIIPIQDLMQIDDPTLNKKIHWKFTVLALILIPCFALSSPNNRKDWQPISNIPRWVKPPEGFTNVQGFQWNNSFVAPASYTKFRLRIKCKRRVGREVYIVEADMPEPEHRVKVQEVVLPGEMLDHPDPEMLRRTWECQWSLPQESACNVSLEIFLATRPEDEAANLSDIEVNHWFE